MWSSVGCRLLVSLVFFLSALVLAAGLMCPGPFRPEIYLILIIDTCVYGGCLEFPVFVWNVMCAEINATHLRPVIFR